VVGFAGILISLIILRAWGDALEGRSVWASWRTNGALVAAFVLLAAAGVGVGRLMR